MCMPKSLTTWIKELKNILNMKGYTKDIPVDVFRSEFMIISGYGRKKVVEWVDNFKFCDLISINDDKVNWK